MRRPWQIWLEFAVALAAVIAATGWLSYKAIQADHAEQMARQQANLDAKAGLALWRLDSIAAPIIPRESISLRSRFRPDSSQMLSDRLVLFDFYVLEGQVGFQRVSDEALNLVRDGRGYGIVPEVLEKNAGIMIDLQQHPLDLMNQLPPYEPLKRADGRDAQSRLTQSDRIAQAQSVPYQQANPGSEFEARKRSVEMSNAQVQQLDQSERAAALWAKLPSMLAPYKVRGQLVLAGYYYVEPQMVVGCVLDWPALKKRLLAEITDLLPNAELELVSNAKESPNGRLMASLPVQLIPGTVPMLTPSGLSPIQFSLLVTWSALALAIAAVAVLLGGVISLSERRAAFVSAVTHELRTPLTTFRMYAEMLSENMVPDEADRRRYLETLRVEADRLTHLVANVLAYARLERGRAGGRIETVTVARLLEVATQRLADRAAQSGLNLSTEVDGDTQQAQARADPSVVEQILFNLVDNACKYAAGATDRTLHLSAAVEYGAVQIRLRDHGPGVSPTEERRLFQPFRKSARDAAQSAPGVGLGLALCRRLAREMGGDLRYDPCASSASFVLTLPKA